VAVSFIGGGNRGVFFKVFLHQTDVFLLNINCDICYVDNFMSCSYFHSTCSSWRGKLDTTLCDQVCQRKAGVNSCTPEGLAGPALLMTPVVLLLDMEIVLDTSLRKQVQIL
jgi:hypothetical protein